MAQPDTEAAAGILRPEARSRGFVQHEAERRDDGEVQRPGHAARPPSASARSAPAASSPAWPAPFPRAVSRPAVVPPLPAPSSGAPSAPPFRRAAQHRRAHRHRDRPAGHLRPLSAGEALCRLKRDGPEPAGARMRPHLAGHRRAVGIDDPRILDGRKRRLAGEFDHRAAPRRHPCRLASCRRAPCHRLGPVVLWPAVQRRRRSGRQPVRGWPAGAWHAARAVQP